MATTLREIVAANPPDFPGSLADKSEVNVGTSLKLSTLPPATDWYKQHNQFRKQIQGRRNHRDSFAPAYLLATLERIHQALKPRRVTSVKSCPNNRSRGIHAGELS